MGWIGRGAQLEELAAKTLFFVGGAPRSGTTWVQEILNAHPSVCCSGEGFLQKHLAEPMEALFTQRSHALQQKNSAVFGHMPGYPLPPVEDVDFTIRTAILLALERQTDGGSFEAIGEKTPENVFFFPRLKQLLPHAKFIGVARDPRDVLSSAWHFFMKGDGVDPVQQKAFIQSALPSLDLGFRAMKGLQQQYPGDCAIVVYEHLLSAPSATVTRLCQFLNVADDVATVERCIEKTRFSAMTIAVNITQPGSFFRKGVAGDWRTTFPEELGELIVKGLPEAYEAFGW